MCDDAVIEEFFSDQVRSNLALAIYDDENDDYGITDSLLFATINIDTTDSENQSNNLADDNEPVPSNPTSCCSTSSGEVEEDKPVPSNPTSSCDSDELEEDDMYAIMRILMNKDENDSISSSSSINLYRKRSSYRNGRSNNTKNVTTVPIQYKNHSYIYTKLTIQKKHNFQFLQYDTAFGFSGDDCTGSVLWGASICLAHYILSPSFHVQQLTIPLITKQQQQQQHQLPFPSTTNHNHHIRVIELGCGSCALPSIALSRRIAEEVEIEENKSTTTLSKHRCSMVATDFNENVLQLAKVHIRINGYDNNKLNITDNNKTDEKHTNSDNDENDTKAPCIRTCYLDWQQHQPGPLQQEQRFHIILASDVVYGLGSVPALVRTIDHLLIDQQETIKDRDTSCRGRVYIAALDGRRGNEEFRLCMKEQTNLCLIDKIQFTTSNLKEWGYLVEDDEDDKTCNSQNMQDNENGTKQTMTNRDSSDNIRNCSQNKSTGGDCNKHDLDYHDDESNQSSTTQPSSSRLTGGNYTIYVYERRWRYMYK